MTSPGIGASSIMGVALETAAASGTYVAPQKFFPYLSETLQYMQDTNYRRPIRNTSGLVGALPGNSHVEGDVVLEATSDVVPYFLYGSRCTIVKTGTAPYTYVATPSSAAIPPGRTLSITVVRNGVVFGYVGCIVGQMQFEVQDGVLQFTASIVGAGEAVQSAPTATWPTSIPYGAGKYSLQIPTATQIFDTDTFNFTSNDNATPQYRMISSGTAATFVAFGESDGSITLARDFVSRTEYDAFKALTAKSITLLVSNGASDQITILAPVSITDTYEVDISAQGDVVRASITYQLAIDSTGKHYQITVITATENITPA
jgi:Phage tail tube protein